MMSVLVFPILTHFLLTAAETTVLAVQAPPGTEVAVDTPKLVSGWCVLW